MTPTRPILRYHGGKWKLAPWIISHFPQHAAYVEPYGGGASVLLQKPRSIAEVYNDLDGEIVNLFRVARDRGDELTRAVELSPYSRADFHDSFIPADDPVEQARRTLIRSYMGFGGNLTRPNRDQTPQRTGFRDYSRKERGPVPATDWRRWPGELPNIIDRLRGVVIENREALDVIRVHDGPEALHYIDPPYVHSTRGFDACGTHRAYRHELTDDDHRELAGLLQEADGMVVVSGYACDLYDRELYTDWQRHERPHRADGARPRTEVLWLNQACVEALERGAAQQRLIA